MTIKAAKIRVIHDDSRKALKEFADNTFDAVVTDPPYALVSIQKRFGKPNSAPVKIKAFPGQGGSPHARAARGFMGQQWDTGDAAFNPEFWIEVLRVLKPGGHVLAFGGSRTYHRLACAVEDAGFEIRDMVQWLYGCLTDDAEILTANGWKRGTEVQVGDVVASWDPRTGHIGLSPVLETICAPWAGGPLIRFVNDDTDQLMTPNHRVYHQARKRQMSNGQRRGWYDDGYVLSEAAVINRWNPIRLPCAGLHNGSGIGGTDYAALLGWVWTEGGFDRAPSAGVRIYQSESANPKRVMEIEALCGRVVPGRKRYDRARTYVYGNTVRDYTETCWFFTGDVARRIRDDLPGKHPDWSLIWRMTLEEKRAFWDAAMKGDGSGDDFYQKSEADLEWAQVLLATMGMRGKIKMRSAPRDGGALCVTPRATTELQARHLRQKEASYHGDVWCVRVDTGAFVARRAGKIFITGNSGFPKSHDVSKSIDKKRGVVGRRPDWVVSDKWREAEGRADRPESILDVTAPATDAARQWEGWGTALKPAQEPIVLARKPLSEKTVAANVQAHGTGAINVDGCRVAGPMDGVWGTSNKTTNPDRMFNSSADKADYRTHAHDAGRWPANVIHDGSEEVLAAFPENDGRPFSANNPGSAFHDGGITHRSAGGFYDHGSAARFFYTAKADAWDRTGSKHPTVKPVDLMMHLCKLITPPGGTVLDPFAGSGTTGGACKRLGFDCVLIEREAEYVKDIKRRLDDKLLMAFREEQRVAAKPKPRKYGGLLRKNP